MAEPSGTLQETANWVTLLRHALGDSHASEFLHRFEDVLFAWVIIGVLTGSALVALRPRALLPGRLQNAVEFVLEALAEFVEGILGPAGRAYVPFLGTLFLYIFSMNLLALVPGMKSPTSSINTTAAMGLSVFLYVQFVGIKEHGLLGYLHHLAGEPRDLGGWVLAPLMLPIHLIEDVIKPISLALRLFGNIFGEDSLIAAFIGYGVILGSLIHSPVGIPVQVPFMLLGILFGTVQALVFTLLSTIYIFSVLPHEEAPEGRGHD